MLGSIAGLLRSPQFQIPGLTDGTLPQIQQLQSQVQAAMNNYMRTMDTKYLFEVIALQQRIIDGKASLVSGLCGNVQALSGLLGPLLQAVSSGSGAGGGGQRANQFEGLLSRLPPRRAASAGSGGGTTTAAPQDVQKLLQQQQQTYQMISNLLRTTHEMQMSAIQNLR